MNHRDTFLSRLGVLVCTLVFPGWTGVSQSVDRNRSNVPVAERGEQKVQFIAGFEWSVSKNTDYVWPFESIRPAPYDSVVMVVEQMPRAWPKQRRVRESVPLTAYRTLRVNGNGLKKPQRTLGSKEEFRVYLEKGRLRFSFSAPSGFKLDPQVAIIRISLYRAD